MNVSALAELHHDRYCQAPPLVAELARSSEASHDTSHDVGVESLSATVEFSSDFSICTVTVHISQSVSSHVKFRYDLVYQASVLAGPEPTRPKRGDRRRACKICAVNGRKFLHFSHTTLWCHTCSLCFRSSHRLSYVIMIVRLAILNARKFDRLRLSRMFVPSGTLSLMSPEREERV